MLSLVPGYMVVSWTLRLSAVGVRVTWGVEGRPEGGGGGRMGNKRHNYVNKCEGCIIHSPRRGVTVVLNHTVPNTLDRVMLSEYSVPACNPMI